MSLPARNQWFALAGAITLAFALASVILPRGPALTAIADLGYFFLLLAAATAMLANGWSNSGAERQFWTLLGLGCLLWTANQAGWVYCEVIRHIAVPDPWFMDVVLFLHPVPMIAAVGLRPHLTAGEEKSRTGTLDFLLLLLWWVFLYAFVVFPAQYVSPSSAEYDRTWGALYDVEGCLLLLVLGLAALEASPGWKKIFLHLMLGSALYSADSQLLNLAVANGKYYTGSLYDVPLAGAIAWMAATALSAKNWRPVATPAQVFDKWSTRTLRLAMLAILTLPALGFWAYRWDRSPAPARTFRLFTVLVAMLFMGVFVFVRQYLQDQELIDLLEESRHSFEQEQRLQTHLVQREKLASLGQLIAGAAEEIDQPLTAIMDYSEKLWSSQRLTSDQDGLVRKIVNHSQRTRELVANLLSFAQQRSGEKTMVDLTMLLQRSVQMRELHRHDQKIRIETAIDPNLPKVWGDGHQLFQAFVQIVENALEALEETDGGLLQVSARQQADEVLVQFSDNGPGIREPHRVFDPFYTTKPIGKGTGLGLSAVYGVVRDHHGQITCHNRPEGGAQFVLRLPMTNQDDARTLAAAQS